MSTKTKAKCSIPYCRNKALARGLCCTHYWRAKKRIADGETTWEKEVKSGNAKTPTSGRAGKLARQLAAPPSPAIRAHVQEVTDAVHSSNGKRGARTCLVPGCTNEATTRGLCGKDYAVANTLVRKGETTWKKLVSSGKAEPSFREISPAQRAKDFFLS